MSETSTGPSDQRPSDQQKRRARLRSVPGCLAVLLAVTVLGGALYFSVAAGAKFLSERLWSATEDYPGPGSGEVMVEVKEGDSAAAIGRALKAKGVVASVQAFIDAAKADGRSRGIQVGYYNLRSEMRAADALEILVDPDNLLIDRVTVREGLRVDETVDVLAKGTDFSRAQYRKVLNNPGALGLPKYAKGNPEGYLFPSTYDVGPDDTPRSILRSMVNRWRVASERHTLIKAANKLDKTPAEVMIIASLVQAEGRGEDMAKVARVIYNRLDGPGDRGGTNGLLQIDAANAYGIGKSGTTALTEEELAVDTPYNTRLHPGLPPTPINSPGDEAIEAATNPADGDWYYYVTVDLDTGETVFTETYDEFLVYQEQYKQWCAANADRC